MIPERKPKKYLNCSISNIVFGTGFDRLSFDVLDSQKNFLQTIHIQNSNTQEQLSKLLNRRSPCAIFAYGMTDIDIWAKQNGDFDIEWSPYEGLVYTFSVSSDDIKRLTDAAAKAAI